MKDLPNGLLYNIFAPELGSKGVFLYPRVVGKPGQKGGNKFSTVCRELKALIRQEPESTVTMLFDYNGLRDDWPKLTTTKGKKPQEISLILDLAITAAVGAEIGTTFDTNRFIPYIQIFEIESLLFPGPEEMANAFQKPALKAEFAKIVEKCGGCELINDKTETAPSKRIQKLVPEYKKGSSVNAHAYRLARHIGLKQDSPAMSAFQRMGNKT